MKKAERKITKIGNSYGVTIPVEVLKEAGVTAGDSVLVDVQDGDIILRKNNTITLPKDVNPKFAEAMKRTIDRYENTLEKLRDN